VKNGPALHALLNSAWLLEEQALSNLAMIVLGHADGIRLSEDEIAKRIAAAQTEKQNAGTKYQVVDGVAIVPIYGVIEKRASFFSDISGMTSTLAIQRDLKAALSDPNVKSILLDIESPGGSVDGVSDLADAIYAAKQTKPVLAYANGLMCSAAYWIGSQASEIIAGKSATVGSIGVYTVLYDSEGAARDAGYKVRVVRAGAMKGAGIRGTEITAEQLSDVQRYVNQIYDLFVTAVAIGRGLTDSQARALADGRVHIGDAARQLGLVDRIATFDEAVVLASVTQFKPKSSQPRAEDSAMADEKKNDVEIERKRAGDLRAAFPKDAAFALEAIEKGWSVVEAKAAYADKLQVQLDEQIAKSAAADKAKADDKPAKTGNDALPALRGKADSGSESGDTFQAKVDELVKSGVSRGVAVSRVAGKHPELHRAFIEASNAGREDLVAKYFDK
jgi:signal peptide peptidase SppA